MKIIWACVICTCAWAAQADTVFLSNGRQLHGEVIQEGPDGVVVKMPAGQIHLRAGDVESIERQTPVEYRIELGNRLLAEARYAEALDTLRAACRLEPASAPARAALTAAEVAYANFVIQENDRNEKGDTSGAEKRNTNRPAAAVTEAPGEPEQPVDEQSFYVWDNPVWGAAARRRQRLLAQFYAPGGNMLPASFRPRTERPDHSGASPKPGGSSPNAVNGHPAHNNNGASPPPADKTSAATHAPPTANHQSNGPAASYAHAAPVAANYASGHSSAASTPQISATPSVRTK